MHKTYSEYLNIVMYTICPAETGAPGPAVSKIAEGLAVGMQTQKFCGPFADWKY